MKNNHRVFLEIMKAGLWGKTDQLDQITDIDFSEIYRIAEEQSVIGLIAAGLDLIRENKPPQNVVLQFVGNALQLEQRNSAMNDFIGYLIDIMRTSGIYALLLKGQGIALNYEIPNWRTPGDIDLLLSEDNYKKAVSFLKPLATHIDDENTFNKHLALSINSWEVELHGSLRTGLWRKIDKELDQIYNAIFFEGKVRSWQNGNTQVFLLDVNEDIIYVFAHILQHFFKEGVGLRQVCDWCRLLWKNRNNIDLNTLRTRLNSMGAMSEWRAFASLAVNYLGMPKEAVPFYNTSNKWIRKAERILYFILETGNFGHNRDFSYMGDNSYFKKKMIAFGRHSKDAIKYSFIFPKDSLILWLQMIKEGVSYVVQRK